MSPRRRGYVIAGNPSVAVEQARALVSAADVVLARPATGIAAGGAPSSGYPRPLRRRPYLYRRHDRARTHRRPARAATSTVVDGG